MKKIIFIGEVDAMNNNPLVCKCKRCNSRRFREAVNSGAKSFEEDKTLLRLVLDVVDVQITLNLSRKCKMLLKLVLAVVAA